MAADYLFIVRHGETKANERGIDAGPLDYPLTKRGVKEASFIAKTLSKVKIDAVYSSPVFRAVETAKILARPHKLKVKTLEELTEAKLKPEFVGKKGRHHILTPLKPSRRRTRNSWSERGRPSKSSGRKLKGM